MPLPVRALAAMTALAVAAGATLAAAQASRQVNVYNWTDYIAEDAAKNFQAQTGIRVNYTTYDTAFRLTAPPLDEIGRKFKLGVEDLLPAGAIYFSMDEKDVQRILAFEHTMIGSDGLPHDAAPHPRLWGTFPRVLGHYARGLGLFPLETAIYKMTGLTAKTFGLADRGVLKQGCAADIALFDADEVDEAASFAKPIQPAKGIDTVVVNGAIVWQDGKATGARPGRVLRRS